MKRKHVRREYAEWAPEVDLRGNRWTVDPALDQAQPSAGSQALTVFTPATRQIGPSRESVHVLVRPDERLRAS